jgi:hypothetical protein
VSWDQVEIVVAVLVGWLVLNRWILPRLGIQT